MKKLTVYNVYLEDSSNVYRVTVPAENKKAAEKYVEGNGDIVTTREAELQDIDLNYLANYLTAGGWGQMEIDVITRALQYCGLERI